MVNEVIFSVLHRTSNRRAGDIYCCIKGTLSRRYILLYQRYVEQEIYVVLSKVR